MDSIIKRVYRFKFIDGESVKWKDFYGTFEKCVHDFMEAKPNSVVIEIEITPEKDS